MGFGDFLKATGQGYLDAMQDKQRELENYKEKYENLSDERILRLYKNASGNRKLALATIINERGLSIR